MTGFIYVGKDRQNARQIVLATHAVVQVLIEQKY
jgi:hypothetical protein